MDIETKAKAMARTFCNGMFSGHQELYERELFAFLQQELSTLAVELRREALTEAASDPACPGCLS